jgi:hypothetical protein
MILLLGADEYAVNHPIKEAAQKGFPSEHIDLSNCSSTPATLSKAGTWVNAYWRVLALLVADASESSVGGMSEIGGRGLPA